RPDARARGASAGPATDVAVAADRSRRAGDAWRERWAEHALLRGEWRYVRDRLLSTVHCRDVSGRIRGAGDVDAAWRGDPSRLWRAYLPALRPILGLDVRCRPRGDQLDHSGHRGHRNKGRHGLLRRAADYCRGLRRDAGRNYNQPRTLLAVGAVGHGAGAVQLAIRRGCRARPPIARPAGSSAGNMDATADWHLPRIPADPRL